MSAPAFTPGPWDVGSRVIEVAGSDFTPIDAAEHTVAFVPVARQANARLIAAAPELYEALEACKAALLSAPKEGPQKIIGGEFKDDTVYRLDGNAVYVALNAAREALAKARGEHD